MKLIILSIIILFLELVGSAPTQTATSIAIGSRKDNIEVQREVQFELFFKRLSETQFEETSNDMVNILRTEENMKDIGHKNNRERRSTIMDTMMRNSSKTRFLDESQALLCMRRCFWERIFFITLYGIEPPPCYC